MSREQTDVGELVARGRAIVDVAIERRDVVQGWRALQERDGFGNDRGPLPYTDEAIALFTAAYERYPEDWSLVHHLAIAHHARAWDRELAGDESAADEWEVALGYWRSLGSSPEFWRGLEDRLHAIDAQQDASFLADLRRHLFESLLEIHVEFIRHYCELEEVERAERHVGLIGRAPIPPAARKRFADRLFKVLTAPVGSQAARRDRASLTAVGRLLQLFPEHLPALRLYAELAAEWVGQRSYREEWDRIEELAREAEPIAVRLANHSGLDAEPLARTALAELACNIARHSLEHARSCAPDLDESVDVSSRNAAEEAFDLSILWGRLGHDAGASDLALRHVLGSSLNLRANCLHVEINEVARSSAPTSTRIATSIRLCERSVELLEEAVCCVPVDEILRKNLATVGDALARLRADRDGGPFS